MPPGKVLDVVLIAVWFIAFIVVAMVHPGVANAIIALVGAIALLWYNTLIRHNPKDDSLRPRWQTRTAAL